MALLCVETLAGASKQSTLMKVHIMLKDVTLIKLNYSFRSQVRSKTNICASDGRNWSGATIATGCIRNNYQE